MPCDIRVRIDNTNIVKLDHGILRKVAEEIALREKGRVTKTATGDYGEQVISDCGIAIHTPGLPGGIALQTSGGARLSFEGNLYQPDYAKIRAELPNAYVDKVVETALRSQHFTLTKKALPIGVEFNATDLAGRQLKILRRPDGKIKFDFGEGFDDAAYHETSDAIKKAMKVLGVEIETTWSQKEAPEKWLEQKIAVIGNEKN